MIVYFFMYKKTAKEFNLMIKNESNPSQVFKEWNNKNTKNVKDQKFKHFSMCNKTHFLCLQLY